MSSILKTIWKYELPERKPTIILAPKGAEVLDVQIQDMDKLCVWLLVNPECSFVKRMFTVHYTGQIIPEPCGVYVGTVQTNHGLVLHVFDHGEIEESLIP